MDEKNAVKNFNRVSHGSFMDNLSNDNLKDNIKRNKTINEMRKKIIEHQNSNKKHIIIPLNYE